MFFVLASIENQQYIYYSVFPLCPTYFKEKEYPQYILINFISYYQSTINLFVFLLTKWFPFKYGGEGWEWKKPKRIPVKKHLDLIRSHLSIFLRPLYQGFFYVTYKVKGQRTNSANILEYLCMTELYLVAVWYQHGFCPCCPVDKTIGVFGNGDG